MQGSAALPVHPGKAKLGEEGDVPGGVWGALTALVWALGILGPQRNVALPKAELKPGVQRVRKEQLQ